MLDSGRVAVNFVTTLDGVVSFGLDREDSRAVGGGVAADRLIMAMLRALAGAIVVGAGTLRASRDHQWTPGALVRGRDADMAALRAAAGLPVAAAPLVVVRGHRELPQGADALARPAVPVTVVDGSAGVVAVLATARELAAGAPILCEGGPTLLGLLLESGEPLDLFLTVAPQLAGRRGAGDGRRSLVEGVLLAPHSRVTSLLSVRRAGDHLFLRQRVAAT
ncbi:MAG: dihydrofolate reductase family protein [Candidatus Dormibacteria bacterium]